MPAPNATVVAAVERFFRLYERHLSTPDMDSLLGMLESLHGLNDKLRSKVGANLFGSAAFSALKALRNFFHHEEELIHRVRILPLSKLPDAYSDLLFACLIERDLVDRALGKIAKTAIDEARATMNWYGEIVDIQPCLFNAAVDVYEIIAPLGLAAGSAELDRFRESYDAETESGLDHRVSGLISGRAGDLSALFKGAYFS